ncbi:MAG TPA: hypothetical protein VMI54_30040 [Polyangiaceae bacterium]|nr:hypothetical protein [Polyangiaceae bacterium]
MTGASRSGALHGGAPPRVRRFAALAGLVAVGGNVLGVASLWNVPSAYRLGRLDAWAREAQAAPVASTLSALAFGAGLLGLAVWARELGARRATVRARRGADSVAAASLVNAAASLVPIAVALRPGACGADCHATARSLLHLSLGVDALFNLGLGLGLVLVAAPPGRDATRWLALVAGIASLPVAAQAVWDPAARLLVVAGPLWLALVLETSVRWLSHDAARA